jgi:hypothetical protein
MKVQRYPDSEVLKALVAFGRVEDRPDWVMGTDEGSVRKRMAIMDDYQYRRWKHLEDKFPGLEPRQVDRLDDLLGDEPEAPGGDA